MWDMSAFVGPWPFRHLPDSTTEALDSRLRREGVTQAFVSPLEGLFAADPQPANACWEARLRDHPFFRFVPVINPTLTQWERALRACRDQAAAVRLLPNYHEYSPSVECVHALMQVAAELGLPVFLQLRMQDVRSMHPRAQVPDVDWREALALAKLCPQTPLIVTAPSWQEACKLREAAERLPNLYLVLCHLEIVDGLRRFVAEYGVERLLWGTHAPLFTPTAARLKVEAARLTEQETFALLQGNARHLWKEEAA